MGQEVSQIRKGECHQKLALPKRMSNQTIDLIRSFCHEYYDDHCEKPPSEEPNVVQNSLSPQVFIVKTKFTEENGLVQFLPILCYNTVASDRKCYKEKTETKSCQRAP